MKNQPMNRVQESSENFLLEKTIGQCLGGNFIFTTQVTSFTPTVRTAPSCPADRFLLKAKKRETPTGGCPRGYFN
jgi:hypothetical protein